MVATNINNKQWSEVGFDVGGLRFFGKRWGTPGGIPLLALHGWLDNCASFDFFASQLDSKFDLICLDCAGHGLSDHRPHLGAYNIWQDATELFAIADQLNWQTFNLLGHSRGGMIAFIAAGTLPERIHNLILLEGIRPKMSLAEDTPKNLAESIAYLKAGAKRPKQYYPTLVDAVTARVKGFVPVNLADAEVLAAQGVVKSDSGYSWNYDYKLLAGSEVRFLPEQVDAFMQNLPIKKLLILAEQGLIVNETETAEWLESVPDLTVKIYPGGHHLHMSEQHKLVAETIMEFIQNGK